MSSVNQTNRIALSVERELGNRKTTLVFKPDTRLKIKTRKGERIVPETYSFLDHSIVVNHRDTIASADIKMIRGKVFGNAGRKTSGVGIAVAAFPVLYFTFLVAFYSGGSTLLATLPAAGMLIGGLSLTGARRFNTANNWTFKIVKLQKY
jgi:hypothetical protein